MNKKLTFTSIIFLTVFNFSTLASECGIKRPSVELSDQVKEVANFTRNASNKLVNEGDGTLYIRDLNVLKKTDTRKVKTSKDSHLDAAGKLFITFEDGSIGECSSGLISNKPGKSSDFVLTADHCFTNKGKKVQSIQWITKLASGQEIKRKANIVRTSGENDITILKLDNKVSFKEVKPFLILDDLYINYDEFSYYASKTFVAGYSADSIKGRNGRALTYTELEGNDQSIRYDYINPYLDATSYQGASGGVIVSNADLSEEEIENPYNQLYFVGTVTHVISLDGKTGKNGKIQSVYYQSDNVTGSNKTAMTPYEEYFKDLQLDYYLNK